VPLKLVIHEKLFPLPSGLICFCFFFPQGLLSCYLYLNQHLFSLLSICPLGLRLGQYVIQLALGLVLLCLGLHLPCHLHYMAGHVP